MANVIKPYIKVALKKSEPLYKQVEGRIRAAIDVGEWGEGERIPSLQELAGQFSTSIFTIQMALKPLEKEGLIRCRPRAGTTVTAASRIGVYFGSDIANKEAGFYRSLYSIFHEGGEKHGERVRLWVDCRKVEDQKKPFPEMLEAVRKGQIQSFIVALANPVNVKWFHKLGVPFSILTEPPLPNKIGFDREQMIRAPLERLWERGCRTVGWISNIQHFDPKERFAADEQVKSKDYFQRVAKKIGFKTKDEWILGEVEGANIEMTGYLNFKKLWSLQDRPEGLVAYPDTLCRGVVTAALELRADIPREMKMVFHKNKGSEFICPFEVDWMVSDPEVVVRSLYKSVCEQMDGKKPTPIYLPFQLEKTKK